MAGLQCRYALEARALISRPATTIRQTRSFHSSIVRLEEKDGQPKPQLRSTQYNQRAFQAINAAAGNSNRSGAQPSDGAVRRPRSTATASSVIDARSTDASKTGMSRLAIRRVPLAPGASPSGSRPRADRSPDLGVKTRYPSRSPQGGAVKVGSGGQNFKPKGKGRGKKGEPRKKPRPEAVDDGPQYTYESFKNGKSIPDFVDITEDEIAYLTKKAEREKTGPAFIPDISDHALLGQGPTALVSTRGSAELLHRLMSRSSMPTESTNDMQPIEKAHKLLHGETVYFHTDEEARLAQDHIKALKLQAAMSSKTGSKKGLQHFEDVELKALSKEDQVNVNKVWLAGTYTAPGQAGGKGAGEVLQSVWRQASRNATYMARDEKIFAKKVGSLVPNRPAQASRPAAKPAAGSAKQTVRA